MKHYSIKKGTALTAAFGMICFASMLVSSSAWAQSGCFTDKYGTRACPVGPEPGGSGGGYSGPNLWNMLKKSGPSAAEKAEQQARDVNNLGVQAYNQGNWATAIAYFNQALQKFPNEPIYQKNLANAQANLANQQAKERAEREAMERQRQNKIAADNMQQSIQNFAQTLNAAPVSGGLDFDGRTSGTVPAGNSGGLDFTATVAPPGKSAATLSFGDSMVVDAGNLPSGLDQATENAIAKAYANAPPVVSERVRKGFQAVMERDWKMAKAWFEDALNRDPGNPGLQRLVVLSDDSQQHVQGSINGKPDDRALQLPSDSDILLLFDIPPARKPTPTFIIGKDGQMIQVPENSDQESPTYIKGKDGKLIEVPQPKDIDLFFGDSPTETSNPTVEPGKAK